MKQLIEFVLNNEEVEHYVDPSRTLLDMIREDFDLTGAKRRMRCWRVWCMYSFSKR